MQHFKWDIKVCSSSCDSDCSCPFVAPFASRRELRKAVHDFAYKEFLTQGWDRNQLQ